MLKHNYGPNITKVLNNKTTYPEINLVLFDELLTDTAIDYIELSDVNGCVIISYFTKKDLQQLLGHYKVNSTVYDVKFMLEYGCVLEMSVFIQHFKIVDIEARLFNKLSGNDDKKEEIIIWSPNKIHYAYLETNYYKGDCGPLGHSCMRQKEMQKALNFYAQNNVNIAVVVSNNNKIKARALFWNEVIKDSKTIPYLDRVYYSEEKYIQLYKEFADKYKYLNFVEYDKGIPLKVENLDLKNITHLPYADTFRYLDKDNKVIYNNSNAAPNLIALMSTRDYGYFHELDPNCVQEVFTGSYISKKDSTYIKRYDGYVSNLNIVDIDGKYYSKHDSEICKLEDESYCSITDVEKEVFTGTNINRKKAILINGGYVSEANIITVRGKQHSKYDPDITHYNYTGDKTEYYHISQCFKCNDNEIGFSYVLKEHAIILYDLLIDENDDVIFSSPKYYLNNQHPPYFKLNTGEYIRDISDNKKLVMSRNKMYYIKKYFQFPDKNQMKFKFAVGCLIA